MKNFPTISMDKLELLMKENKWKEVGLLLDSYNIKSYGEELVAILANLDPFYKGRCLDFLLQLYPQDADIYILNGVYLKL